MDQFAELKPGQRIPGIPTQPWNKFLAREKGRFGGDSPEGYPTSAVEVLVANDTGGPLDAYAIVGLDALGDYAGDPDTWRASDIFAGGVPAASSAVAILQNGLGPGDVGFARLAGRSACRVDLTDVNHLYAAPTNSTDHLTSAASGPIRIVALENDWTATGPQWAVVILVGASPAAFVRFHLAAALATADVEQANCPVDGSWGIGGLSSIKVSNLPTHSAGVYVFSGVAGAKGLATYDPSTGKWWIVQMECDAGGGGTGGGCTGFTGTIGN